MKSLFIARTPFQLFNCIEAKSVFDDTGKCYLLCIYRKDIDRMMMEKMIEPEEWNSVVFFKLTFINRLFYPIVLRNFLNMLKGSKYCFFGLITPMISHCVNVVNAQKNILFDDGNEIFLIIKKIANKEIYYIAKKQKIYNFLLGRKIDYNYAHDLSIFTFFDLKGHQLNNRVIFNDYHAFKEKVVFLPRAEEVFFIGSNLIDTYMDRDFFEENMLKVVNYYNDLKVVYVLHRYEDRDYLEDLGRRLGFEVIQFPMILEMALLKYGKIPKRVATFRSTALETLGYLYAPIEMEVFETDIERLLKPSQKDEFIELYNNYSNKHIPMINLKGK